MRKSNQGFTLIELIMVIVILGVLAAVALPRFANFSGDARAAAVQGMAGGLTSASAIIHAQWLVRSGDLTDLTIAIDGTNVSAIDGYASGLGTVAFSVPPTSAELDAVGIIQAIGGASSLGQFTVTGSVRVADGSATPATPSASTAADAGQVTFTLKANCFVTYTEAFDDNADAPLAAITSPVVISDFTGC